MSEGGAGGAPAAGGAAAGGVPTSAPAEVKVIPKPGAAKATDKEKSKKPAEGGEPEWGEKDDADLFERMQKAPWAKVKANGEERTIKSREDFLALATDASRARGTNKLVEQTKKEAAEAKAVKEEHAAHKALLERARKGDPKALRELGLVPDNERAELQKQWEALSPEVQETFRRNHELEQEVAAVRAEKEAKATEEKEKAQKLKRDEVMQTARGHLKEILKDLKEDMADIELPEVIGAMRTLMETGQRIGRDYTKEQLSAFVQQRREAALNSRVSAMKPDAAMRLALPHLKALVSTPEGLAQLEAVLGVDFESVFKPISDHRVAKWKASKTKEALKPPSKQEKREQEQEREPLSPFRYRG